MNTAELKALADQCICHPASRGIADIEAAGEGLKHLISQLEDAQGELRALRTTESDLLERVKALELSLDICSQIIDSNKDRIGYAKLSSIDKAHKSARALLEKKK